MSVEVLTPESSNGPVVTIFLAGGCQNDYRPGLSETILNAFKRTKAKIVIYDPVVKNYGEDLFKQVQWESACMGKADIVCFWFNKGSYQPLSIYELAKFVKNEKMVKEKRLIVGFEEGYSKINDLKARCRVDSSFGMENCMFYSFKKFEDAVIDSLIRECFPVSYSHGESIDGLYLETHKKN